MVITLRLWKGNDSTVGCQILVTSGVTVALHILCKMILCMDRFGFISCYAHPAVKMLQYKPMISLLYILETAVKLSLSVFFFLEELVVFKVSLHVWMFKIIQKFHKIWLQRPQVWSGNLMFA